MRDWFSDHSIDIFFSILGLLLIGLFIGLPWYCDHQQKEGWDRMETVTCPSSKAVDRIQCLRESIGFDTSKELCTCVLPNGQKVLFEVRPNENQKRPR